MATSKKQFSSSLDEKLLDDFKNKCSTMGIAMNTVLECLISDFCKNDYAITISSKGMSVKRED
jgi:hypothetical protein|nr:MAG TPA: bifunctional protein PutA [Bacteriophage sp.]